MDETDWAILRVLSENSRESIVEISKKIGVSRATVTQRIEKMEESGIIEKYSIIINPRKSGLGESIYFDLCFEAKHLQKNIEILVEDGNVVKLYQTTGSSKLHGHAILSSREALQDFLTNTIYKLEGLLNFDCNFIISRLKDNENFSL